MTSGEELQDRPTCGSILGFGEILCMLCGWNKDAEWVIKSQFLSAFGFVTYEFSGDLLFLNRVVESTILCSFGALIILIIGDWSLIAVKNLSYCPSDHSQLSAICQGFFLWTLCWVPQLNYPSFRLVDHSNNSVTTNWWRSNHDS